MRPRKLFALFIQLNLSICALQAQQYFPVKLEHKWGLINTSGELVQPAVYDAIGEFKHFGYAVMQKNGMVGLLGSDGRESLPARYEDLKVLDNRLVAVMEDARWRVINHRGETVLDNGYQRINILKPGYLRYQLDGQWGLVAADGREILPPKYDQIEAEGNDYFLTQSNDRLGLVSLLGTVLIAGKAREIRVANESLVFYREEKRWGAVNAAGQIVIPLEYDSYQTLDEHYIKLFKGKQQHFYTLACAGLVKPENYTDFYAFSEDYLVAKHEQRLGLINACGREILPPLYQEIQPYGEGYFRVKFDNSWGVVDQYNEPLIPLAYQYISPMQQSVCVVKQNQRFGVINMQGDTLVPLAYHRIELEAEQARAYTLQDDGTEQLTLFSFTPDGQLLANNQLTQHFTIKVTGAQAVSEPPTQRAGNYQLAAYEWFYNPETDRWGLRNIFTGDVQIEPTFDFIRVDKALGYTLVGIWKANDYEFERTTFRHEMIFGLILNELGILVTEVDFLDVRLDDFRQGMPTARVVFSNGRHGLIDKIGRIVRQDITYIGEFTNGLARVSFSGQLSGSRTPDYSLGNLREYLNGLLSPSYMLDYTQYDQLFQQNAQLTCDNCEWGYMDSLGQVTIKPQYTFAGQMTNGAGLVNCEGKWGMVSAAGQQLIDCRYDRIEFLANTDNRMVRVYLEQPKFGLIDTLGQLAVSAVYEEIGSFSDGRLAVKQAGRWGFVDAYGKEIVPCRYEAVQDFSEGKAAVKLNNRWGFIDPNGDISIPFTYQSTGNFRDGLAWVEQDRKVGYINAQADYVIPPNFDQAFDFYRGVARVVSKQEYGLIDRQGQFILRPRHTEISAFDQHGLAIVRYGKDQSRHGIINLRGEVITTQDYREVSSYSEGLARVRGRDGYGFVDTTGRLVIDCQYSRAGHFNEQRAVVQRNNKCGYIDQAGTQLVPCEFSRCQDYSGGRAVVYQGIKNAGLLNHAGEVIVEPSLDRLIEFQEGRGLMRDENYRFYYITEQAHLYDGFYERAGAFQHGVAVVQIGGKWGVINQKGIEIIPPKYGHIDDFENGYARVKIEGYNGLSNLDGELIVQPNYEFISYAGEGLFRVEQGDKVGYFDSEGRWVWELKR